MCHCHWETAHSPTHQLTSSRQKYNVTQSKQPSKDMLRFFCENSFELHGQVRLHSGTYNIHVSVMWKLNVAYLLMCSTPYTSTTLNVINTIQYNIKSSHIECKALIVDCHAIQQINTYTIYYFLTAIFHWRSIQWAYRKYTICIRHIFTTRAMCCGYIHRVILYNCHVMKFCKLQQC